MNWILVGSGSYEGKKTLVSFEKKANIKNNSVSSNVSSKQKQKRLNNKAKKRIKTKNQLTSKASKLQQKENTNKAKKTNKASRKISEIIKNRIEGAKNHDIERILPKII